MVTTGSTIGTGDGVKVPVGNGILVTLAVAEGETFMSGVTGVRFSAEQLTNHKQSRQIRSVKENR
jgi:hypothetical protein